MLPNLVRNQSKIAKSQDSVLIDADFGRAFKTQLIGLHWIQLLPGQKSSNPHAESHEEEFVYILKGHPHLWVNGFLYSLFPGMAVGFPAGTGIAHCLINNTNHVIECVVLGDRTKPQNQCAFPCNPELLADSPGFAWKSAPPQILGPHDGAAGRLEHLRPVSELSFVKTLSQLERQSGFSYPGDNEKFGLGIRLTDAVGLKSLGVWHEILPSGKRSSWPHAHLKEEEFAVVLRGHPMVWLNGESQRLSPGDCVFFPPATNFAHVLINDSGQDVEYLSVGLASGGGSEEKIFYPLHETWNEQSSVSGTLWQNPPEVAWGEDLLALPILPDVEVTAFENGHNFLQAAGLLLENEAEYSLMLGLCQSQLRSETAGVKYQCHLVQQAGTVLGAAVLTEKSLILTRMPEPVLLQLARNLEAQKIVLPAAVGPAQSADSFARIWSQLALQQRKLGMSQKIYQLTAVKWPPPVPGRFGLATDKNVATLATWLVDYTNEALPHEPLSKNQALTFAERKVKNQEVFLWLGFDDRPMAMCLSGRPTDNGVSISGVFTPKEFRRQGAASAVVAHTSATQLAKGKSFCVLYTDVANPTSNRIYAQIGYTEIATSKQYLFIPEK